MTKVRSFEESVLDGAEQLFQRMISETVGNESPARLEVLEAAACRYGGINFEDFRATFADDPYLPTELAQVWGDKILDAMGTLPIAVPLALSALARVEQCKAERRRSGAYYTDFRLASYLADGLVVHLKPGMTVIDPAAGSGLLLVALAQAMATVDGKQSDYFIANSVCAADLSPYALRGTRLALASLTADINVIRNLDKRLYCGDTLLASAEVWEQLSPGGFSAVIGNPPWEKLRVTRHELLANAGIVRHYGAEYLPDQDLGEILRRERDRILRYINEISEFSGLQGSGEVDLYKLFLGWAFHWLRPDGRLAFLVPAGLIRSQGTEVLRRFLLDHAQQLDVTVFENRSRFFAIDTRFKFLALQTQLGERQVKPLSLCHAVGNKEKVVEISRVPIPHDQLRTVRPDLTLPEVRDQREWKLFLQMTQAGQALGDAEAIWRPQLLREVDMTSDQEYFRRSGANGNLPLLEGRMLHHFRVRAKAHISGTGRAARWIPLNYGTAELRPQFWFPVEALRPSVRERTRRLRAGFCDVTGQTNERTLLAAVVPAGVVCGNKVPTVTFDYAEDPDAMTYLWVALMNSLPVDWLARRVTTTTMNYFLLLSLPLPRIDLRHVTARRLIDLARKLTALEQVGSDPDLDAAAEMRVEVDLLVAEAYGLTTSDLKIMLQDFRLLDRGQPGLPGESRSTITQDLLLTRAQQAVGEDPGIWAHRLREARDLGAVAYVAAQYATGH